MKYKNILFRLNQMSDAELEEAASIFIPFYGREFKVEAFGSLGHITGKKEDGDRMVVVCAHEAKA